MPLANQKPFTYGHLFSKKTASVVFDDYITGRLRFTKATDFARAIAVGKTPKLPEGVDPADELTDREAMDLTGVPGNREMALNHWRSPNKPYSFGCLPHELAT